VTVNPTAAALRDAERQITNARRHVQARMLDLEEQRRRHMQDAVACLDLEGPLLAAARKHLREAAGCEATCAELRRVESLL
jgi:hypothetical protein